MRIRILGSTQFLEQLVTVRTALEKRGHSVVMPRKDERVEGKEEKRKYLEKLRKEFDEVDAVLVMNFDHAIAAQQMLELGVALYLEKRVFIYDMLTTNQQNELAEYPVAVIKRDLSKI